MVLARVIVDDDRRHVSTWPLRRLRDRVLGSARRPAGFTDPIWLVISSGDIFGVRVALGRIILQNEQAGIESPVLQDLADRFRDILDGSERLRVFREMESDSPN